MASFPSFVVGNVPCGAVRGANPTCPRAGVVPGELLSTSGPIVMPLSLDNILLSFTFSLDCAQSIRMCVSFPCKCPTVLQSAPDLSPAAFLQV